MADARHGNDLDLATLSSPSARERFSPPLTPGSPGFFVAGNHIGAIFYRTPEQKIAPRNTGTITKVASGQLRSTGDPMKTSAEEHLPLIPLLHAYTHAGVPNTAELLHLPGNVPSAWRAAKANEEAAHAWHRGRAEEALDLWCKQESSVPVLFNRGIAALFLGRSDEARTALTDAVAPLPYTDAWHHLGHRYLALADARR
jgi:hypothetical protein